MRSTSPRSPRPRSPWATASVLLAGLSPIVAVVVLNAKWPDPTEFAGSGADGVQHGAAAILGLYALFMAGAVLLAGCCAGLVAGAVSLYTEEADRRMAVTGTLICGTFFLLLVAMFLVVRYA